MGAKVFFDEHFVHEMLGKDGVDYLNDIFFKNSRFSIVLLSADYEKSHWTQVERRAIAARSFSEATPALIPVLVDGYKPSWLLPTTVFFDLKSSNLDLLTNVLIKKLSHGSQSFQVLKEFKLGKDMLVHSTDRDNEFILCEGAGIFFADVTPGPVLSLSPREDREWTTSEIGITTKAKFIESYQESLAVMTEDIKDSVLIFDRATKSQASISVPEGRFNQVHGSCSSNGLLCLGRADGGSFLIDFAGHQVLALPKSSGEVDYTKPAFGKPGKVLLTYDYSASLIAFSSTSEPLQINSFEPGTEDEYLWSAGYNERSNQFLVIGSEWLYLLDGDSLDLNAKKRMFAPDTGSFSCARHGFVAAAVGNGYSGAATIDLYDTTTGEKLDSLARPPGHKWDHVCLSPSGRYLCGQATDSRHESRITVLYERT